MEWYIAGWQNALDFSGRSRRKAYWMYTLFAIIVNIAVGVVGAVLSRALGGVGSLLYLLFALVTIVPGLAVSVRRLHDTNHSGWWLLTLLIPFVGLAFAILILVWMVTDGDASDNQYGPNPKAGEYQY